MSDQCEQERPVTTTNAGSPAPGDEYSLTVGPGGPNLLQDRYLNEKLAHFVRDVFALYVKTKNFHWHMSGGHFRDYHLLLDEHGNQIFAMTDVIAERAPKLEEPRSARSATSRGISA